VGLSDDQKAMLRLLAQREEGYEDMAKLMGISVDELRQRVREALAEVEASPGAGQPPSSPPAAAASPASASPPSAAAASEPAASSPEAQEPTSPSQGSSASGPPSASPAPKRDSGLASAPPAPKRDRSRARRPRLSLPEDRGALIGLGAGALAVIALVIVLIVGGGDGGGDSSAAGGGNESGSELTAAEERNLTQAVLVPTGDVDASGRALFGRYKRNVLLQVEADGLEPSPQGSSYTVWLYRSPKLALQIGAVRVGEDGKLAAQFQVPAQLLTYVANGSFDQVDVSLTPIAEYKAAFNEAKSQNKVPPYVGESVLRGEITGPAIEAQQPAER
jgi:hypothetical protein